jgi:dnd system-associated protein 4
LKTERTIAEAARIALQRIGRPSTIFEIYQKVTALGLYKFNTPTPEHVLRTEIRRKTLGVERADLSADNLFKLAGNEVYELMKEPTKRRGTIGIKRIQRAGDKEAIIELLTSDSVGAFREIWRLLFFAAMVGFKNGKREPLTSTQTGEGIRQDSFANNPVWLGTVYLLGLVETGGTDVLRASEDSEDERIKIFEEYANGGLQILKETFETSNGNLDTLLTFIQSQTESSAAKTPDLQIAI